MDKVFLSDPLTYKGKLQIGTGMSIYDGLVYLNDRLSEITASTFVIVGSKDTTVKTEKVVEYYENIGSTDKELLKIEGNALI